MEIENTGLVIQRGRSGFWSRYPHDFLQGKRVRVRKGAMILSDMHPQRSAPYESGRATVVTVDHCLSREPSDPDFDLYAEDADRKLTLTVRWAGAGGYWKEVAVADIDLVED